MTIIDEVRQIFHVDNLYQVLNIASDSNQQQIKKAYLAKSRELHPDKISDLQRKDEFKRKFQILTNTYQILADEGSRLIYDQQYERTFKLNKGREDSLFIYDEINFSDCDKRIGDNGFYYTCKCSGLFELDENYLKMAKFIDLFIIDCDSCSNSIKINLNS